MSSNHLSSSQGIFLRDNSKWCYLHFSSPFRAFIAPGAASMWTPWPAASLAPQWGSGRQDFPKAEGPLGGTPWRDPWGLRGGSDISMAAKKRRIPLFGHPPPQLSRKALWWGADATDTMCWFLRTKGWMTSSYATKDIQRSHVIRTKGHPIPHHPSGHLGRLCWQKHYHALLRLPQWHHWCGTVRPLCAGIRQQLFASIPPRLPPKLL